jgi:hypothetical protein
MIGKSKKPNCFKLYDNPPLPYKDQKNAWFDKDVMRWWITHVFWPYHVNKYGDVPCVLLLDNFSGHKNLGALPNNLHILFFPANVTNSHQPADMGLIAAVKVGYKSKMLELLSWIFLTSQEASKRRHKYGASSDLAAKVLTMEARCMFLMP